MTWSLIPQLLLFWATVKKQSNGNWDIKRWLTGYVVEDREIGCQVSTSNSGKNTNLYYWNELCVTVVELQNMKKFVKFGWLPFCLEWGPSSRPYLRSIIKISPTCFTIRDYLDSWFVGDCSNIVNIWRFSKYQCYKISFFYFKLSTIKCKINFPSFF